MTTYLGQVISDPKVVASTGLGDVGRNPAQGFIVPSAIFGANNLTSPPKPPIIPETFRGKAVDQSSGLYDFFEDFHVLPREFDLGNVLSDQTYTVEVFSAFRRQTQQWTSFTNGAGVGVDLNGAPTLPASTPPLTGYTMSLQVSATGPAFVEATLDFGFSNGTAFVPISLQRIVLFAQRPVFPLRERLSFLTNIIRRADGTEQRIALRYAPRKSLLYLFYTQSISQRQRIENLLFDWQARTFGVPLWHDETVLTAAATAGDTSLTVESTDQRDFRVGSLVAVFVSDEEFDVVEVASLTSTTIQLASGILGTYSAGAFVIPLETCRITQAIRAERYPVNASLVQVPFESIDNKENLADTSAFATFNSKVLIVENAMRGGTVGEEFESPVIIIDSETGTLEFLPTFEAHRRASPLTLRAEGRSGVWALRRLLYALRGRQVSFYLARSTDDLQPVANLTSGQNTLDVAHVGYAQFVRHRQPKNIIRVSFTSGATPLLRTITASTAVSSTVEQLTLDANWPATYTPSQVSRIEYVELVRLDEDDIEIEYGQSGLVARASTVSKTLLP